MPPISHEVEVATSSLLSKNMADPFPIEVFPVLTRRVLARSTEKYLVLPLTAQERTCLRGRRRTSCGQVVILQLPRQGPLRSGESLASAKGPPLVKVEAASEPLLIVSTASPVDLLKAAYHLGNRHVALELRTNQLRLLHDPVLANLLRARGCLVESRFEPFNPEVGAYLGGHGHDDLFSNEGFQQDE